MLSYYFNFFWVVIDDELNFICINMTFYGSINIIAIYLIFIVLVICFSFDVVSTITYTPALCTKFMKGRCI